MPLASGLSMKPGQPARLRQADGHAKVSLHLSVDNASHIALVPNETEVQCTGQRNGDWIQISVTAFVKERNLDLSGKASERASSGSAEPGSNAGRQMRGAVPLPPVAANDDLDDIVEQDKADNKVTFFFVKRDFILSFVPSETCPSLPNFQELRRQGALEVVRTSKNEALHGALRRLNAGVVSHRWETPLVPDPDGKQLAEIQTFLDEDNNRELNLLWKDFWCIPQGNRTRVEEKYFRWLMRHMDFLYLACEKVLALIDMSSQSRFWTQFEAWMAMQSCTSDGLHPASEGQGRCHFRCIHSAEVGKDDKKMEGLWAEKTPREACELLKSRDVAVTNQTDKELWLPLLSQLDAGVRDAFSSDQAVQLIQAGKQVAELESIGFSKTALLAVQRALIGIGFSMQQVREAGFSIEQMHKVGFNAGQLREAGFDAGQVREEGFDAGQVREAGFNAGQAREAGFDAGQLREAGFDAGQLREAGFNAGQLREAGFNAGQLREAGFDAGQLHLTGFTCGQLREAGFDAGQVREAGCNAGQLREAGFTCGQLREAGFNAWQLRVAGFDAGPVRETGFNAGQLREAGFNAGQLRELGFTAGQLHLTGFTCGQLRKAGFDAGQVREVGFNIEQMHEAGFTCGQLYEVFYLYGF